MRSSALTRLQRNKDILKGFPVLVLVILAFSFLKTTVADQSSGPVPGDGKVIVQIEGDVRCPGVYTFDHEPAVNEVLEKAKADRIAAREPVAGLLHSGSKVTAHEDNGRYAYSYGEISSFNKITLGLPVSINRESEEGLAAVPGIGPLLAGEIIRERNKRGGFKAIEELKTVSGVGDKKYKTILNYVTL
jgi:competence protein ComEA